MKKAIAVLFAVLMAAMPFAFAGRISVYGDVAESSGNAVVGEKGYVDISDSNREPDVFVCAYNDGTIKEYGMNLQSDVEVGYASGLIEMMSKLSFAGFDHYGCLRARV